KRKKSNNKTAQTAPMPVPGSGPDPQHDIAPVLVPLRAPCEALTPLSCRGEAIGRVKKGGFLTFVPTFVASSYVRFRARRLSTAARRGTVATLGEADCKSVKPRSGLPYCTAK